MKKLLISSIIFITLLTAVALHARTKQPTWDRPVAEQNLFSHDGYFYPKITITRVETTPDETRLHMEAKMRPEYRSRIQSDASLTTPDGKRYPIKRVTGIELDSVFSCPPDDAVNFTLHFNPLPQGTSKFDFSSGSRFRIDGITAESSILGRLIPSNWRNDLTGDWVIGFYREGVIYRSHLWKYATERNPGNSSEFDITDGKERITVKIGKLRKGERTIDIAGNRIRCSMITGGTLPPYPSKETDPRFADTRYARNDTAVINGWLKDRPEAIRKKGNTYTVLIPDIIKRDQTSISCTIDSMGMFTLRIPLINSTECFMDWDKTFLRTFVEPGETYFLLYDFATGQCMFMGDNCRTQNELIAHPLTWNTIGDGIPSISSVDSLLEAQTGRLDKLISSEPTLSERFYRFHKDHNLSIMANRMGQSRFQCQEFTLPDSLNRYLRDNVWPNRPFPYTLHREFMYFIGDFMENAINRCSRDSKISSDDMSAIIAGCDLTEAERVSYDQWQKVSADYQERMAAITDSAERAEYSFRFGTEYDQLMKQINALLSGSKVRTAVINEMELREMKTALSILDSLGDDNITKDLWLTHAACKHINNTREPMPAAMQQFLNDNITVGLLRDRVNEENEIYVALEQRIGSSKIKNEAVDLADVDSVNDGKQLLEKIIAPHKGHIILLDIWGTWCAPCRQALSRSQELYKELAPYDMVFIYLANNSPENSWRNIIEQYDVKGENCFHYRLPSEQQDALENYLGINAYPSYRLIDPEGNLLKVNASPHDLDALKKILDKLR